jgi:hypothetical protein
MMIDLRKPDATIAETFQRHWSAAAIEQCSPVLSHKQGNYINAQFIIFTIISNMHESDAAMLSQSQ